MNPTDIANQALGKLGEPAISSFDENTPTARAVRAHYAQERDSLLRLHRWNFARGRAELSQLADAPLFGFKHQYALPSDWLRVLELNGISAGLAEANFEIEGSQLLTDSSTAKIVYVRRVEDPAEWDTLFVQAFVLKLGAAIAIQVTESIQKQQLLQSEFVQLKLQEAIKVDANESKPRVIHPGTGSESLYSRGAGVADLGFDAGYEEEIMIEGDKGDKGWSPVPSVISDGVRRVISVLFQGGEGTAPESGFVSANGIVSTAVNATDIRGEQGDDGRSAYESYVATTSDDPVLSESEWSAAGGGIADHGALSGLNDDDHTQYHTDARGDLRYTPLFHASLTNNPHSVTASQVGLGNVNNTADTDKPVSTAQQTALDLKANSADLGTAASSNTGDFATSAQGTLAASAVQPGDIDTLAGLNSTVTDATLIDTADSRLSDSRPCNNAFDNAATAKTALSLDNVDNTSDADKPVSTAAQTALDLKADSSSLGTAATLDAGTSANNVVQLNGSGQLPAVDGSNLTGISGGGGGANLGDSTDISGILFGNGTLAAATAAQVRAAAGLDTTDDVEFNSADIGGIDLSTVGFLGSVSAPSVNLDVSSNQTSLSGGGVKMLAVRSNNGVVVRHGTKIGFAQSSDSSLNSGPAAAYSVDGDGNHCFGNGTASDASGTVKCSRIASGIDQLTVGTLPTASANAGIRYEVTDASSPTEGATVASGGSALCEVRSNGTNWIVINATLN